MSSDPFTTLGPSDSGFLNSFLTPSPSSPLQSRVGEESLRQPPPQPDSEDAIAADSESVLESDTPSGDDTLPLTTSTVTPGLFDEQNGPTDEQLDAMLRDAPLPEGFLGRMRRVVDEL